MWEQKLQERAEKFLEISYFLHALQIPPDKCLLCNSLEKYSVEMTLGQMYVFTSGNKIV